MRDGMVLRKVISGGQTGADREGLECARRMGLETGGMAPKGYRTDDGNDHELASFGLIESTSRDYPPRTEWNVVNSDATVWFGQTTSPGYWCTRKYCIKHRKELFPNPTGEAFRNICMAHPTINIAGNRARTNSMVIQLVRAAFKSLEEDI